MTNELPAIETAVEWAPGAGVRLAKSAATHVFVGEIRTVPEWTGDHAGAFRAYPYSPIPGGPRYFATVEDGEAWIAKKYADHRAR